MTLLTGIATTVHERQRAVRRFNDVRHMANSFMFEVDDEIQRGPTKARAILVKRALEYLDSLAQEAGSDGGLQLDLAAGYIKVGDIQGKPYRPNLGDTAAALASYRKAQALLETLTASTSVDLEARRYLSLTYQSMGRVQGREGDWASALNSQRSAVAVSEALLAANPTNAQNRGLVADNYLRFGEALDQPERGATVPDDREAIEYFQKALAIHEALASAEPTNGAYSYAAGVDYEYLGIIYNRLGDLTGDPENHRAALENHLKEFEINQALAASDPANATYRRIVADVYGEVGLSQLKLGRTTEALENFRHMLAIFESVRSADPTNVEAQHDVAISYQGVGQALTQAGDSTDALAHRRKALTIFQALSQGEPLNTETRINVIYTHEAIGRLLVTIGDLDRALESYRKGLALLEAWAGAEPENVLVRRLIATEDGNLGGVYVRAAGQTKSSRAKQQTDWRTAHEWYQRSLKAWQELRAQGRLNEADTAKMVEATNEIARCTAALSHL